MSRIHSLTAAAPITLARGKLDLSGGSSTAGTLSDSSPFSLAGGTLSLANVQPRVSRSRIPPGDQGRLGNRDGLGNRDAIRTRKQGRD